MRAFTGRLLGAALALSALASCGDGETAQISKGGNEVGPTTTKAVTDRAVPVPAVRNVLVTNSVNDVPVPNNAQRTAP